MPQRILRFRINQDGIVEETVEGALGESCQRLTERVEEALGVVQRREPTSEAYLCPEVQSESISAEQIF